MCMTTYLGNTIIHCHKSVFYSAHGFHVAVFPLLGILYVEGIIEALAIKSCCASMSDVMK